MSCLLDCVRCFFVFFLIPIDANCLGRIASYTHQLPVRYFAEFARNKPAKSRNPGNCRPRRRRQR